MDVEISELWSHRGRLAGRRVCALAFAICAVCVATFADGAEPATDWTLAAGIRTPRGQVSAVTVDNMVYVIGGSRSVNGVWEDVAIVERYDPAKNTWKEREPMNVARVTDTSSSVVDGIIYTFGGKVVESYDPDEDIWEVREDAELIEGRYRFPTVAVNGLIYALSGGNNRPDPRTDVYDPSTDEWTRLADIPTPRMSPAAAAVDGIIYVIGGETGTVFIGDTLDIVEAYDPATDTWSARAPMPTPRMAFDVVVVERKIYAIAGSPEPRLDGAGPTGVVEIYDPATDTWSQGVPLPERVAYHGCAVSDGVIYTTGGWGHFNVWSFDTGTGPALNPQPVTPRGRRVTTWATFK